MKRADVTTLHIMQAVAEEGALAFEVLCQWFPPKVVLAALRREYRRGLIDYGVAEHRPFFTPDGVLWARSWRLSRHLGKRVRVTLSEDGPLPVAVVGKLTKLDEDGEAVLLCDDGKVHYCWPALKVEELPLHHLRRWARAQHSWVWRHWMNYPSCLRAANPGGETGARERDDHA